jgi:hypothetical protein
MLGQVGKKHALPDGDKTKIGEQREFVRWRSANVTNAKNGAFDKAEAAMKDAQELTDIQNQQVSRSRISKCRGGRHTATPRRQSLHRACNSNFSVTPEARSVARAVAGAGAGRGGRGYLYKWGLRFLYSFLVHALKIATP